MIAVEGDLGEADPAALRYFGRVAHGAPLLGVEVVGDQLHGVLGVVLPLPLDGDPEGVADLGDALGAPALLDCKQPPRDCDLPVDGALGVDMDAAVPYQAGESTKESRGE